MKRNHRANAFTLIELLTVIAIIGVLIALLFPAVKSALLKAETTKAQTAISGLATAFRAYYTEYGKWPIADINGPEIYDVTTPLYGILKGEDGTATFGSVTYQGNPRHIVFLEFKAADLVVPSVNTTNFVDPWKKVYHCNFDVGYVNQVPNPFVTHNGLPAPCPGPGCINAGFIVWSAGPDGQTDPTCGDPPGPYFTSPCVNKDNVKSW
jgi:prepilin-type N-terminal cleavage/methylation domain-containing protein